MITPLPRSHDQFLAYEFSGKLSESDYTAFVPEVERAIASHGKVRILLHFHNFAGWNAAAFWRDVRFSMNHYDSIERFAVVGEEAWQKALIELAKPLTSAEVRYFPSPELEPAWDWITQTVPAET